MVTPTKEERTASQHSQSMPLTRRILSVPWGTLSLSSLPQKQQPSNRPLSAVTPSPPAHSRHPKYDSSTCGKPASRNATSPDSGPRATHADSWPGGH